MRKSFYVVVFVVFAVVSNLQLIADQNEPKHYSVQEYYDVAYQHLHDEKWNEALMYFQHITTHFPDSPFFSDALFYTAVCYCKKGELDLANKQLEHYLNSGAKLTHFEKVFDYKLDIANQYAQGVKRRLFGLKRLPKWALAKNDAIILYDEIISALPGKEIAALALYNKADLELARRHYGSALTDLQTLCRKFPTHSLAAESYLLISEIYLKQSELESQNPDLAALAQVNVQKFTKSFPSDERVEVAKKNLVKMQEVFAKSLWETGRFYERIKKPNASIIYYADAVSKYPETEAAHKSEERLAQLK